MIDPMINPKVIKEPPELIQMVKKISDNTGATFKRIDIIMSAMEKEELKTRINAMEEEEIMTIVEMLPVELCAKRVLDELEQLKKLEKGMQEIMKSRTQPW